MAGGKLIILREVEFEMELEEITDEAEVVVLKIHSVQEEYTQHEGVLQWACVIHTLPITLAPGTLVPVDEDGEPYLMFEGKLRSFEEIARLVDRVLCQFQGEETETGV